MRFILDFAYILTAVAISPMVIYRMLRHNRYRAGWRNRFGKITRKNPAKKCIWIHAVSVGEVNASRTIIEQLKHKAGDLEIVISSTTDTGFARATALFGAEHAVFYFPLDISFTIRRAFGDINPAICLLMELEVWPNFVDTANKLNVPVVVVNGRISDKSFSRYKKVKPLIKKIFSKITLILAQTEQYAQRFRQIGAAPQKVIVTGSLKYDTAEITDKVSGSDTLKDQLGIDDQRLWVAGGTGNDEEKILLEVYNKLKQSEQFGDLRLAIVPRKPERFNEVAELIKQFGFSLTRFSRIKDGSAQSCTDKQSVILGDTMGDLRKFYSLANIIFVGRSLVPMGGSDMLEAAALGKCTMFGAHCFNFKQTVDALIQDDGALLVKDQEQLLEMMQKCLSDAEFATEIAKNGQEVIRKNQGATDKTVEKIVGLLRSAN